jgi:hypothetical protein
MLFVGKQQSVARGTHRIVVSLTFVSRFASESVAIRRRVNGGARSGVAPPLVPCESEIEIGNWCVFLLRLVL